MNVETGLKLIEEYIKEMTGKDIKANPPRNVYEQHLFELMSNVALQYFQNKKS